MFQAGLTRMSDTIPWYKNKHEWTRNHTMTRETHPVCPDSIEGGSTLLVLDRPPVPQHQALFATQTWAKWKSVRQPNLGPDRLAQYYNPPYHNEHQKQSKVKMGYSKTRGKINQLHHAGVTCSRQQPPAGLLINIFQCRPLGEPRRVKKTSPREWGNKMNELM